MASDNPIAGWIPCWRWRGGELGWAERGGMFQKHCQATSSERAIDMDNGWFHDARMLVYYTRARRFLLTGGSAFGHPSSGM